MVLKNCNALLLKIQKSLLFLVSNNPLQRPYSGDFDPEDAYIESRLDN
jgi:hypothetical protein